MITTNQTATTGEETPDLVTLSGRAVAQLVELLDHCYAFLLDNDLSLSQLREYCRRQPNEVTALWVVDQLAWHALLLRLQLVEQAAEDRHG